MNNTNEKVREVRRRAGLLLEIKTIRRKLFADIAAGATCTVLIIMAAIVMPTVSDAQGNEPLHYGSMILAGGHAGYVIIGALGFALGVFVTLICLRVRDLREKERKSS
ncbi:MAG: hypothetical protein IIY86_04975 [Lachnospiraceae bacterium]|nr:hypothetical protein [Lachnospiraceae bacterium]